MKNQPSPLQRFVQERIESMAISEDQDKEEAAKQGVSIRLDPGRIRGLDHMAKQLDISRQALLLELVKTGLHEVITAWANSYGDDGQKVYREIADLMSFKTEDL
jgi:hypothetical protein